MPLYTDAALTRYMLVGASLLLAAATVMWPASAPLETVTATALRALMYAFTPAVVGYAIAYLDRLLRKPSHPERFHKVWHWTWGILLTTTAVGYFIELRG